MVMHPIKPELDGNDLTQAKDPTGLFLFTEFSKTVKASGAGFVFYMWPKPGSAVDVQKALVCEGLCATGAGSSARASIWIRSMRWFGAARSTS